MMDLRKRAKEFALMIIKIYSSLSKTTENQILGKLLLRSGASVGHTIGMYAAHNLMQNLSVN